MGFTTNRGEGSGSDRITMWRASGIAGLELLSATLVAHEFGRHAHETLAIGVIDEGEGAFWCGGETHVAGRDCLVLIGAGEVHTGHARTGRARYRMLYPDQQLIEALLGPAVRHLRVTRHAPHDPVLAHHVRRLHRDLSLPRARIDRETALVELLERLVGRYLRGADEPAAGHEPRAVRDARAYLEAHPEENVSLRTLAGLVDLHPAYLNRVFRQAVGLPPHAYLTHLRVTRAKDLLADGTPASAVAQRVGFVDQSHLTRHFRRAYGVTPGRYQARARRGHGENR